MQGVLLIFLSFWNLTFAQNSMVVDGHKFIEISKMQISEFDTVYLHCNASCIGIDSASDVSWYSSLQGFIGKGEYIKTHNMQIGEHVISIVLVNGDEKITVQRNLSVLPYAMSDDVLRLVDWMTGYFSSAGQADTSSDKYHVDVRLRMRQIWSDSAGGAWLYVEQAYADDTLNPYRQRIYRIYEANGVIVDEVYGIPNDSLYVLGWQKPELMTNLMKRDLLPKENCGLVFEWDSVTNCFRGHTNGYICGAGIPGVKYITSDSEIFKNLFTSWDLGYNNKNEIVMGPFSPYIFEKISDFDCVKPK